MASTHRRLAVAASAASLVLLVPLAPAFAGHANTLLEGRLTGRAEVGTSKALAGDPNGRGEVYVNGIDGDPATLCYVLTVSKIAPAHAAHIHKGVAGSNGPVVVNLAAPADGNAADCLTEGETGKFVGDQTVADILAHPEQYYVNVHNEEFPSGAIRGQLSLQH